MNLCLSGAQYYKNLTQKIETHLKFRFIFKVVWSMN